MCARVLSHLLLLYIGRVHGAISGCTVLWEVHPASAQNKSLISDTVSNIYIVAMVIQHWAHTLENECLSVKNCEAGTEFTVYFEH